MAQRGISADEFHADLDDEAKENAEQSLALDALFEARAMELTDADIDEQFQVVDDPAAARKSWEESGRMSLLREGIRRYQGRTVAHRQRDCYLRKPPRRAHPTTRLFRVGELAKAHRQKVVSA